MNSQEPKPEVVSFRRRSELSGVEIRTVHDSARSFRSCCPEFEFLTPLGWRGEIWHGRRQAVLERGWILCAHPCDVFLGRPALERGARCSLSIDASTFDSYLSEHGRRVESLRFRSFAKLSTRLEQRLFDVFELLGPGSELFEVQQGLVELVGAMAEELLEASAGPEREVGDERRAAEQVRECLHYDLSSSVDLATVAKQTGMSRFRALRAFKNWYGLPPHSYLLALRLGLAQKSLRQGLPPAAVAVEYGFVDQSHLTKHFRRRFGVTPAKYAGLGS